MFVPKEDRNENLWTVGYYIHDDEGGPLWFPMEDFTSKEEAWAFIHYLNGGSRVLFNS